MIPSLLCAAGAGIPRRLVPSDHMCLSSLKVLLCHMHTSWDKSPCVACLAETVDPGVG